MRKRIASAVMAAYELARSVRHLAPSGAAVCKGGQVAVAGMIRNFNVIQSYGKVV